MAKIWAKNSHAKTAKVGALLVKNQMIISDGYNGTPHGFDNECETVSIVSRRRDSGEYYVEEDVVTKPSVLHAEANAITKVAKSNNSSDGATLYVTMAPCIECAKLIIQAGIIRVVYTRAYRKDDGIKLLKEAGIELTKIV